MTGGILTKTQLGVSPGSLMQEIFGMYGQKRAAKFLTDTYFLLDFWLKQYGFTLSIADCRPNTDALRVAIDKDLTTARMLAESIHHNTKQLGGGMARWRRSTSAT